MNKRNNNSGGGQSSLGYLFGFDGLQGRQQSDQPKVSSPRVSIPPYGIDYDVIKDKSPEKAPIITPTNKKLDENSTSSNSSKYIYHGDGDKSRDVLVTGRPSTKVRSVPGGDSSLGYLFGDK